MPRKGSCSITHTVRDVSCGGADEVPFLKIKNTSMLLKVQRPRHSNCGHRGQRRRQSLRESTSPRRPRARQRGLGHAQSDQRPLRPPRQHSDGRPSGLSERFRLGWSVSCTRQCDSAFTLSLSIYEKSLYLRMLRHPARWPHSVLQRSQSAGGPFNRVLCIRQGTLGTQETAHLYTTGPQSSH